MKFFAFQGNVNKKLKLNQLGEISGEVYKKENEKWIIENRDINIVSGDIIYYWIYIQVNETMHIGGEQTWTVANKFANLLFHETFDSLKDSVWNHEVKIPLTPDYEFCVYHNDQHSSIYVENGFLKIKPLILENLYGDNATTYGKLILSGCTSKISSECERKGKSFHILPPILSGRLNTKNTFSFQYGKIEIRARFPKGDWLYPEMWLQPKYDYYGPNYSSGCVILGLSRGNENLISTDGKIYDSRTLDFGLRVGTTKNLTNHIVSQTLENGPRWTKDFHTYTTIWDSNGFQFFVDGKEFGKLTPQENGWMYGNNFNKMAPFDQEFYITLGVGVGGIRVFPDGTTSSGNVKPWKNVGAKAMLQFWHAKDQWLSSWRTNNEENIFEIDYIRIWSL